MPKGTRDTNTMMEALRGVLQDLAFISTLPDADLEFVSGLQNTILQKVREPIMAYQQQVAQNSGMGGAPADPMGGAGAAGMGGMAGQLAMGGGAPPPPAAPPAPSGGVPGVRNGGTMPPVDELRRLLEVGG